MTKKENAKLRTILIKLEVLQKATADDAARERIDAAKAQLMRIEVK